MSLTFASANAPIAAGLLLATLGGASLSVFVGCDNVMNRPSNTTVLPPGQRRSRWHLLAAITASIHLSVLLSPIQFMDLRSGLVPVEQYLVLLVPAAWSIFMFLRFRERRERIVSYCSFGATILWFISVGFIRS